MALTLGVLVVTGAVELWMVVALAFGLGSRRPSTTRRASRSPRRWWAPSRVRNAVTLNSMLVNVARAVGPAVAGLLIATTGTGICFLVNAVSYAAVLAALLSMDQSACGRRRAPSGAPDRCARGSPTWPTPPTCWCR